MGCEMTQFECSSHIPPAHIRFGLRAFVLWRQNHFRPFVVWPEPNGCPVDTTIQRHAKALDRHGAGTGTA